MTGVPAEAASESRPDPWYKNPIIYAVDVGRFQDSNGDGIGDFPGLTSRLDYLSDLGVTCLWLLPFYPSPNRDNGYDITDFYGVDPRFGTPGDVVEFVNRAHAHGLRLLPDLVATHTSNEHPWFLTAERDAASPFRDFYVWADRPVPTPQAKPVFPGFQDGVWTYDATAGQYYWHRFYAFEPALDNANPRVQAEFRHIVAYWLALGMDGFRLDAAPFMVQPKGLDPGAGHAYLRRFCAHVEELRPGSALMAEANLAPDRLAPYFTDGLQLLMSFLFDSSTFLALAEQKAAPLARLHATLPPRPATGQWANFLRNLDELSLERLTEQQRRTVFAAFAPEPRMRIYGRGIRRRLAAMLGRGPRLRLALSLLFTFPGAPLFVYGDEIGMGDDLGLPQRESVRTAMQWSDAPNGGFSTAPTQDLAVPVLSGGEFGYQRVNVAREQREPGSLLHWMKRAIQARKASPELGCGTTAVLETGEPEVFAHCAEWRGHQAIAVHNLSDRPCTVSLNLDGAGWGPPTEIFGDDRPIAVAGWPHTIELRPYGYRWFRRSSTSH